jgi:hypothetical protein
MDYIVFIGVVALFAALWRKHNKDLDRKMLEAEEAEAFDYEAAKERAQQQQMLLDRYEKINQLMDDVIVANNAGEDVPLTLSWYSHSGEPRNVVLSVEPENMVDFVREIQRECSAECSAALSVKTCYCSPN